MDSELGLVCMLEDTSAQNAIETHSGRLAPIWMVECHCFRLVNASMMSNHGQRDSLL
jgi:hypothetical protein